MWKKIPGIASNYEVNSNGEFRNIETNNILRGEYMDKGYIRMHLRDINKKKVRVMAHVLVAKTFIGEPPSSQHQVNHIDSNKQNNSVDNLEWVTPQENVDHRMENMSTEKYREQQELMSMVGKKYGVLNGKRSAKPVAKVDLTTGEIIRTYSSAREAGEDGYSYRSISQVCNNKRKSHKGYGWKFV